MNEEQMIQVLNQIPLEELQNYVAQRVQQEQAASQEQAYAQGAQEGALAQQAMMARGGYIANPYVDIFACGGRVGHGPRGATMIGKGKSKRR